MVGTGIRQEAGIVFQSRACVCPFCCRFYTFQDLLNNLPVSATYHYCCIHTRAAFRTQPREQEPINSVSSPKDLTVSLSVRQQSVPLSLARQEDVSQRGGGEASTTTRSLVNICHITRPALSRKLWHAQAFSNAVQHLSRPEEASLIYFDWRILGSKSKQAPRRQPDTEN